MWDIVLPVVGRCQECGEDLSGTMRIWATASWIERYNSDDHLRRGTDRAVERKVLEQHRRACSSRPRQRAS